MKLTSLDKLIATHTRPTQGGLVQVFRVGYDSSSGRLITSSSGYVAALLTPNSRVRYHIEIEGTLIPLSSAYAKAVSVSYYDTEEEAVTALGMARMAAALDDT